MNKRLIMTVRRVTLAIGWSFGICLLGCFQAEQVKQSAPAVAKSEQANSESANSESTKSESTKSESAKPATAGPTQNLTEIPSLFAVDELASGWISLFDGQTLFGWQPTSKADWHVSHGTIAVSQGEKGLLCTAVRFKDYELKLDFRAAQGTNSGVFLRTPLQPTDPATDCYELNIAPPDNPFPTGGLVKRRKASEVPDSTDWQTFHVVVDDNRVKVTLNEKLVCDYVDPQPLPSGYIGLQLNEGSVAFRNIKLRPIKLESLFNGKDLTGWRSYPKMPGKFSVTSEGFLQAQGGPGQLETADSFGDFVMQFECISQGKGLNSGVFFRSIPEQEMMGYEFQIDNTFKDNDRTKPANGGTGGIFRRQEARIVAADDFEWFSSTLVADGPRIAAWVNGIQVTDWTDTRKPDENPRKGLRLEPGTIILQSHDATSDFAFRNLRIAKL